MIWTVVLVFVLFSGQTLAAENPAEGDQSIQPVGPVTPPFPDVPESHWAFDAVEKLRRAGIMIGYPDGTFEGEGGGSVAETVPLGHSARDAARKVTGDLGTDRSEGRSGGRLWVRGRAGVAADGGQLQGDLHDVLVAIHSLD